MQSAGSSSCPFDLIKVCETCWRFHGVITKEDGEHLGGRSQAWKHNWNKFSIFLLLPSRKTVGPLPKNHKFIMCHHAGKNKGCTYRYHAGQPCRFVHSLEELEVWKWMLNNGGKTLLYANFIMQHMATMLLHKQKIK